MIVGNCCNKVAVITVVVVTDAVLVFVRVKSRDISFENALFDSAPA